MMKKFYLVVILFLCMASQLHASGFGVFTQGAKGLAQSNAVTAHSTGPSSLYFNPALLLEVEGTQIEVGTTLVSADRTFKSDETGLSEDGEDSTKTPSTLYVTSQFNNKLSAGLGIFFPFGLSTEWNENWEGRYIATTSDVSSTNINPAITYKMNEHFTIAAGIDVLYLDADLRRKFNSELLAAGLPDAEQKFTGNGWGVGYNIGMLYKLNEEMNFGATFRSHIDVDIDGTLKFNVPATAAPIAPLLTNTGGKADIRLPRQATFGLAWETSEALTVECGARWEDWSSTRELRTDLDQPILGQSADIIPRDWDDTWAFNVGGEYQLNETTSLMAGYLYSDNPVPRSTFDPTVPDSDAHLFTIGTSLVFDALTLDLAYGFEHHDDRDKKNQIGVLTGFPANGEYAADIHLFAASLGYKF